MKYRITGTRGVLEEGTPFVLDEGKDLVIEFEGLKGNYFFRLDDKAAKHIDVRVKDNKAVIQPYRLRAGLWYAELIETDGDVIADKIICTPLKIQSLSTMTQGLICYPEIDEILKTVAELTVKVEELLQWRDKVAPLIHEHKIIK